MVQAKLPEHKTPYATKKIGGVGFTIGAETGGNTRNIAMQLRDQNSKDLAVRGVVRMYLSDDSGGNGITTRAPSGGIAIGTDGKLLPINLMDDALLVKGTLAIHSTPEQFKTSQAAYFRILGVQYTKAATTALTFSAGHVITASKFGVILVQIDKAGTISTKVPASPQAYNSAALALAALPAPDANKVALGYIAIENNAGDWTANTDDLTDGSDLTSAAFVDNPELGTAPRVFDLISEADGDIDINIVEAGGKTWYLVAVLPDGTLVPSSAITFAA